MNQDVCQFFWILGGLKKKIAAEWFTVRNFRMSELTANNKKVLEWSFYFLEMPQIAGLWWGPDPSSLG